MKFKERSTSVKLIAGQKKLYLNFFIETKYGASNYKKGISRITNQFHYTFYLGYICIDCWKYSTQQLFRISQIICLSLEPFGQPRLFFFRHPGRRMHNTI
jgi:hypothetical protein